MITLKLRNGTTEIFNLPNFDKERKFLAMWKALYGDEQYLKKRVKVTFTDGRTITPLVNDMLDCQFSDCVYVKPEPVEPPKKKDDFNDLVDDIITSKKRRERSNLEEFTKMTDDLLKKKGVKGGLREALGDSLNE